MSEQELASIPGITKKIEQYKNDIKKLQEEINKHYEKLTKIYFKLRKILEDKENHEEKLICNPLKKEKEKEYKKLLNDYKNKKLDFQKKDEKHNENVECYCSHDCFLVCKPGATISRDDICDRCGKKWKWHYSK